MIFAAPTADDILRAFTAETYKHLFVRRHDRGNMALHRRHFLRPPTRGFWKGCKCFGCRMRGVNAPRAQALATVLSKSFAEMKAMAESMMIATTSRADLERLARVHGAEP